MNPDWSHRVKEIVGCDFTPSLISARFFKMGVIPTQRTIVIMREIVKLLEPGQGKPGMLAQ